MTSTCGTNADVLVSDVGSDTVRACVPSATPTFETERLILRGWEQRDFAALVDFYANDPASIFVGGPRRGRDVAMWFMARMGQWALRGYGALAIEERASGAFAGWCGVNHYPDMNEPHVQYALVAAHRGKGYMTEAGRRVFAALFAVTGRDALLATIHPKNSASQATARRLGAAPTGETVLDDGHTVDVWRFLRGVHA